MQQEREFRLDLFRWQTVKCSDLVVIVGDPETACVLINRVLKLFPFHQGDLLTGHFGRYQERFPYRAEPSAELLDSGCASAASAFNARLKDIVRRQWGHGEWGGVPRTAEQRGRVEELSQKCARTVASTALHGKAQAALARYVNRLKPIHHLRPAWLPPAQQLDAAVQDAVNRYLCVPTSYLVFHHARCSAPASAWLKRRHVLACLGGLGKPENKTVRIVSVDPEEGVPPAVLSQTSLLVLFFAPGESRAVVRKWWKAALSRELFVGKDGFEQFKTAVEHIGEGNGLVVDLAGARREQSSGAAGPSAAAGDALRPTDSQSTCRNIYWTTNRPPVASG